MAYARRHGGKLVLRIEDTDRARSSDQHELGLMEALRWAGIEWQEGPDVGGPHGLCRQSERIEVYSEYAKQLVDQGCAYYSFTTPKSWPPGRKEQRNAPFGVSDWRQYRQRGYAAKPKVRAANF